MAPNEGGIQGLYISLFFCAHRMDCSSLNTTYATFQIGITMPSIRDIGYNIMIFWTFCLHIPPPRLISSVLQILRLHMPLTITSWFHFKNGSTFCILTLILTDPLNLHQSEATRPMIALLRRLGTTSRNTLPCLVTLFLGLMF
jgi:hypothetical protein